MTQNGGNAMYTYINVVLISDANQNRAQMGGTFELLQQQRYGAVFNQITTFRTMANQALAQLPPHLRGVMRSYADIEQQMMNNVRSINVSLSLFPFTVHVLLNLHALNPVELLLTSIA